MPPRQSIVTTSLLYATRSPKPGRPGFVNKKKGKTVSHPSLTPAQAERLEMLAEEAAEVIQVVTKILRRGYASYHPDDPARSPNSRELERELADLDAIRFGMSLNQDPIPPNTHPRLINDIWASKQRYTHHQEE